MTVDKMFEYDFGFDYCSVEEQIKELCTIYKKTLEEKNYRDEQLGFWNSLIKEDIIDG